MLLDGREKLFAIAGGLGLIIGIVALVFAISAKNSSVSNDEVEKQVEAELRESIEGVKGSVTSEQGKARRAERRASGGIAANTQAIKKLQNQNKKLQKSLSSTNDEVSKLTDEVKRLTGRVSTLSDDLDQTNAKVRKLNERVEDLSVRKKNR